MQGQYYLSQFLYFAVSVFHENIRDECSNMGNWYVVKTSATVTFVLEKSLHLLENDGSTQRGKIKANA